MRSLLVRGSRKIIACSDEFLPRRRRRRRIRRRRRRRRRRRMRRRIKEA